MVSDLQLDMMCEIENLCYPETTAYDRDMMRDLLEEPGTFLVCEWRGGRLAGFLVSQVSCATIVTIDVHPDFRRQGIARLLMRRSLDILRETGLKKIISQVGADNVPSLMLHLQFGFRIQRRLRNYYGPADDAVLMMRKF